MNGVYEIGNVWDEFPNLLLLLNAFKTEIFLRLKAFIFPKVPSPSFIILQNLTSPVKETRISPEEDSLVKIIIYHILPINHAIIRR